MKTSTSPLKLVAAGVAGTMLLSTLLAPAGAVAAGLPGARLDARAVAASLLADDEDRAAWDAAVSRLERAVEDATSSAEGAKGELDVSNGAVADLEAQVDDVQERLDELTGPADDDQMMVVDDLLDFYAWLHRRTYNPATDSSACSAALGYLAFATGRGGWGAVPDTGSDGSRLSDHTHLGEATDATHLDNVLLALDVIDELNRIRTEVEHLDAVEVSLAAMVESAFYANWSAGTNTLNHGSYLGFTAAWGGGSWGENACWGYSQGTALQGWYWQEKANYLGSPVTDLNGLVYSPEPGGQTGHYLNIIRPGWNYTGVGYATDMPLYGTSIVNDFSTSDALGGRDLNDRTYTTDELRSLIAQARDEGVVAYQIDGTGIAYADDDSGSSDEVDALRGQLADLSSRLDAARTDAQAKQTAYDAALAAQRTEEQRLARAVPPEGYFGDVPSHEWFHGAVQTAFDEGYMNGTSAPRRTYDADGYPVLEMGLFAPNESLTRGQVACVLFNASGEQLDESGEDYDADAGWVTGFSDIDGQGKGHEYYAEAVAWCGKNGVVNGFGDGTFRPDQAITREEFIAMLSNYALNILGDDTVGAVSTDVLAGFPDGSEVSAWAASCVAWAAQNKVAGNGGLLLPASVMTRAYCAAMLVNYLNPTA